MTSLTPQRKSTRICRPPVRFNPDASAWTPGSTNGVLNPAKIDHWQLRFNGHAPESQNEKKSDNNYENATDMSIQNDKEAEKDRSFIVSDHDSDIDSDYYDSELSWSSEEDVHEVECQQCGQRWDGNAQCFPCVSDDESEQEIEDELLQNHKEDIANE